MPVQYMVHQLIANRGVHLRLMIEDNMSEGIGLLAAKNALLKAACASSPLPGMERLMMPAQSVVHHMMANHGVPARLMIMDSMWKDMNLPAAKNALLKAVCANSLLPGME